MIPTASPPNAEIRFRRPNLWTEHRLAILSGAALVVVQAGFITILTVTLRRQRKAEIAARESQRTAQELSGRLIDTQEEERNRIARDLHDDFNQRLALLSVEIDILGQKVGGNDPAPKLRQLGDRVRELSSDLHQLAYQLHPAKLDQLGLTAAVNSLCRDISEKFTVNVAFKPQQLPRDVPVDLARCVFRVTQESLQNIVRHSGAENARVELSFRDGSLQLEISDDGSGFDIEAARAARGLGLLSMRERTRLTNGNLEIHSQPGQGTRVELTIPLKIGDTSG